MMRKYIDWFESLSETTQTIYCIFGGIVAGLIIKGIFGL